MTYEEFKEIEDLKSDFEIDIISPADSFFVFYNACKLSNDKVKVREKGNKVVFHYYFKDNDYASISDEEYFEQIQFEITPVAGQEKYFTNNLNDFNTIFEWGCYCDWPDSLEARQNEGMIEVIKLNDTLWSAKIEIKNIPLKKEKKIIRNFTSYTPKFELAKDDTINRTDEFNRKQGHWITEDLFTIKNGLYKDNYFTGSNYFFMYYNGRKTISWILTYKDDQYFKDTRFDHFGQIEK